MHDLTKRLIDRVHAQTLSGEVPWAETGEKNAFAFEADGYNITVEATGSTAAITVADSDGRALETVDEEELAAITGPGGRDYESIVREVHAQARRVALGTDDAIERILRALGEEEASGEGGARRGGWR